MKQLVPGSPTQPDGSSHLLSPRLAAIAGLADLSDESCRWHRGNRPLRAADDNVPAALLPSDSASPTSTVGIVRGDDKSDGGVDFAPDHRGVSVGQCTSLFRDRDTAYGPIFRQRLRAMGIRDKPTAARFHRAIERFGVITSQPVLGGLHHQYCGI